MTKSYPLITSPGYIGNLEIKNRVAFAPIGTPNNTKDGHVTQFTLDYYDAIAAGGTGLIVLEATNIDRIASKGEEGQLSAADNSCTPGLARLANVIHDHYGCKCAIQLCHIGQQLGLVNELPSWAPSDMDLPYNGTSIKLTGMTEEQIQMTIANFATAAWRTKVAGFDAVEIHASGGHLLNMFLSPLYNHRTDAWGGSTENRARILIETIKAVKQSCGKDFPVLVRLCGDDFDEGGCRLEESIEIGKMIEAAGCDCIDMNAGSLQNGFLTPTMFDPAPTHAYIAEAFKKAGIKIPIIIAGSIVTPDIAEDILAKGQADFVGLARPLLADPDWIKKILAGKADEIRPCIRCSMGCVGTFEDFNAARGLKCSVNPYCNRTTSRKLAPITQNKKNVAVIGGGPGGMEVACVATERGHDVTIYEKRKLGGALHEAAFDPAIKGDIQRLTDYYVTKVNNLGIKVINEEATAEKLIEAGYDAVVVATGAKARGTKVPGFDKPHVFDDIEVCGGKQSELGDTVVVVGGGVIAAEISISEAMKGKKVILSTRRGAQMGMWEIANNDSSASWMRILGEINMRQIDVKLCQTLVEITDEGVIVADPAGNQSEIKADSVVICAGYKPDQELYQQLKGKVGELYLIGDAVKPRLIGEAVHEGWAVANQL